MVELCRRGDRSIGRGGRDFDLTETNVRRWVNQAEIDPGGRPGLTSAEHDELVQLRRENRRLEIDNETLKRATAFMSNPRLCAARPGREVSSLVGRDGSR